MRPRTDMDFRVAQWHGLMGRVVALGIGPDTMAWTLWSHNGMTDAH